MKATISLTLEVEKLLLIAQLAKAVEDGKIVDVTDEGEVVYSEQAPIEDLQAEVKEIPGGPTEETQNQSCEEDKKYTIEELRELTSNFLKGSPDNKEKVKDILADFGVKKLPELNPEEYGHYIECIMKEMF